MEKSQIDPAEEIYEIARKEASEGVEKMEKKVDALKEESFSLGVLKKIQYDNANNRLLEHAVLFKVKKEKEYKKGGMTWTQFCETLGLNVRSVDRALKDIRPLVENFSDKMTDLAGINFNKIRYLGRSTSAKVSKISQKGIEIDDRIIPISEEYKDEIEAYIDDLKATEKKIKSEKKEQIKAKERVIENLHKTIEDQAHDLARYGKRVGKAQLSALEKDQLKILEEFRNQFNVFATAMAPGANPYLAQASSRIRTEYGAIISYAVKMLEGLRDEAHEELDISIFPELGIDDGWVQPDLSSAALDDETLR